MLRDPGEIVEGIVSRGQYGQWVRSRLVGDDSDGDSVGQTHDAGDQCPFDRGTMGSWTDEQLLAEFLGGQEGREPALRVLIERYGPWSSGFCRILRDEDAAEDAFQATFLVLVRKADSLRGCKMLTNWIYGLRHPRRPEGAGPDRTAAEVEQGANDARMCWPDEDVERTEVRSVIDEEIEKAARALSPALILCYVEGLQHDEVARRLGCPVGTVEADYSRARDRLRTRLTRPRAGAHRPR